jgi:hypothetical protein
MKGLVWWLRSAFCRHEWAKVGMTQIFSHDPRDGHRLTEVPQANLDVKECRKCGWIWRQRL